MDKTAEVFPEGTPIEAWFYEVRVPGREELDRQYVLTQYHIFDDEKIYTAQIQKLIATAAADAGQYQLSDFTFENLRIAAGKEGFDAKSIQRGNC